ncbi:transmembrane protein 70 homolog, mitochondrial [Thrips palmi]|uniref:Transmembrane protein 70 homolog, mitochondrial n=1 Tax=Thrips palmi TaxID=161013 RepID=A0A6P8Y7R1_THRPL|nr:transmembrane protein 70 homolog, mitochondrial [Thrips palmi]
MLRVFSGRCLYGAITSNSELRVAKTCVASNLTPTCQVSERLYLSLQRNLSSAVKPNNDESREIIYKGRLEREIIRVKVFSMTTSVMGLVFQPVLYNQASSLPVLIATCTVAGFFTFVTPVLLHQLAKRHVNRITYSKKEDNYIAHTTSFFFKDIQIPIAPGEAKVPDNGGMFTTMEVRGIPLMVETEAFDKSHLIRLLGYDKPMDFEHERLAAMIEEADRAAAKAKAEATPKQTDVDEASERQRKSDRV